MADVLVIGAGIVGCAVADALASRGAAVQVIDPRGVAAGATQASGGMLTPHAEGVHAPELESLGVRSLALYDGFVARAAESSGRPVVYARTGSLHVAFDAAEAAELERLAAAHGARGIASTLLPGDDARRLEHELAADAVQALLIPAHGFVGAAGLADALWTCAVAHGALMMAAAVERIAPADGGMLAVTTSRGTFTAPRVVLAAGSWAATIDIEGTAPLPVRPVRGQLLHLRWPAQPVSRIVWGARCYTVPWPDGTMLVGATSEDVGFEERATVTGVRDLLDAAAELMPRAWQAGFTGVKVGLRPATPDELPFIGRSALMPGLVYATGHYRNGVLLAPLTAELVAKALDGEEDPALDLTAPSRFGEY